MCAREWADLYATEPEALENDLIPAKERERIQRRTFFDSHLVKLQVEILWQLLDNT